MKLSARVLNEQATTNSFVYSDAITFVPGAEIPITLRLWNEDLTDAGDRYVPPATAVVTLQVLNSDGTLLTPSATMNPDDRSMLSATVTPTQSVNIIGGNIVVKIDLDGSGNHLRTAIAYNALERLSLDAEPLPFIPPPINF